MRSVRLETALYCVNQCVDAICCVVRWCRWCRQKFSVFVRCHLCQVFNDIHRLLRSVIHHFIPPVLFDHFVIYVNMKLYDMFLVDSNTDKGIVVVLAQRVYCLFLVKTLCVNFYNYLCFVAVA